MNKPIKNNGYLPDPSNHQMKRTTEKARHTAFKLYKARLISENQYWKKIERIKKLERL